MQDRSRSTRGNWSWVGLACAVLPLGLMATAMVRAGQPGNESADTSQLPAAPLVAAPPALRPVKPTTDAPEITALRAGAAPYAWAIPGALAKSFITNTPGRLDLAADARLPDRAEADAEIRWKVTPPAGFVVPADAVLTGPELRLSLRREGGNPTGMGAPLTLSVTAEYGEGENLRQASLSLTQDSRDRLRQEYVDLERGYIPERRELIDEKEFAARYGKRFPSVTFAELNFSRIPGGEERYPVLLADERLVAAVHRTELAYGRELVVSSGFRNPVRQEQVHGSVNESHHQYGRAADLYVPPDSAPPRTGRSYTSESDWLRLAAASIRGGGVWIEPMTQCHVNTAGCHVHLDVREDGARSQVVRVAGRVTDPGGRPVSGAQVRLAGMPGVTNAEGRFSLKHVVVPGEMNLEIEAPGQPKTLQPILVGETLTEVACTLPVGAAGTALASFSGERRSRGIAPAEPTTPPVTRAEAQRTPVIVPPKANPDAGATAGGLAVGGAAAAAQALWKRKGRKAAEPEPKPLPPDPEDSSILPAEKPTAPENPGTP